jgi:hypothetical protein
MQSAQPRILAINPGSRYLGFAVFYGPDLREWKIHVMRQGSFREKVRDLRSLISDIAARYGVNTLATKKLESFRSSKELRNLTKEINAAGKSIGLKIREFSIDEVKGAFFPSMRANKRELMEDVVARYPFLFHELDRARKGKHPYFVRMFEAIAVGVVCCSEFDSENSKADHHGKRSPVS